MTSHSETSVSSVSAPPGELSTADLLRRVSDQVRDLVRDEAALARDELAEKGRKAGVGAGLGAVAGVLAAAGGLALVAAGIAALALVLPVWAAALVVGGALLLVAGVLGLGARAAIRRAVPPVPEAAVEGLREDARAVTHPEEFR
ncbi:MAG: phage holin family protein [Pseudonocardiaceae bacterium]|nr:MAG: phage holin family protein [Pseudonocardiaceae bacterium]